MRFSSAIWSIFRLPLLREGTFRNSGAATTIRLLRKESAPKAT